MTLSAAEVRRIGLVARLDLSDDAIEGLQGELNTILDYVSQMQELDLGDVKPTTHSAELTDGLREDVLVSSLSREDVLLNAPQSKDGAFLIPQIKAMDMSAGEDA